MTYVMSDIHGQYTAYMRMLKQIRFSNHDTLYLLGDVIDRGEHGIQILLDILKRQNVIFLLGNHEYTFLNTRYYPHEEVRCAEWTTSTWKAFCALSEAQQQTLYDYLDAALWELHIAVKGRSYHLVHGRPSPKKGDAATGLLWGRFDQWEMEQYSGDEFVVFGHTPTKRYQDMDPMCIYFSGNGLIGIDCGCAYQKSPGRLGCLCLDNWEAFYEGL